MEKKRNEWRDAVMTDVERLISTDHLVRKIEAIMEYDCAMMSVWLLKKTYSERIYFFEISE